MLSCDATGASAPGTERPMAPRRGAGAGHLFMEPFTFSLFKDFFQIYFRFSFYRPWRVCTQAKVANK